MVLLTMTPLMVEALEKMDGLEAATDETAELQEGQSSACAKDEGDEKEENDNGDQTVSESGNKLGERNIPADPSLSSPKVGNSISHGQVINISRAMKAQRLQPCSLELLLKGSRVYIPPPTPKPDPASILKLQTATRVIR